MNIIVPKTPVFPTLKQETKSLAEIRDELNHLSKAYQRTIIGGVVFRIRRKKKLCGNIVPE